MPSYHTLFLFSSGLRTTLHVPVGTCRRMEDHVNHITEACGLTIEQHEGNHQHWSSYVPASHIDDKTASSLVRDHNEWVVWVYERFAAWAQNPPDQYEDMTPEFAATIWHGLSKLHLPVNRWSAEYYQEEMQSLFDVMRGEDDEEITWNGDPLTPRQSAEVIHLFSTYLDKHDIRLELPSGWTDQLLSSDDYEWCPEHGAIPDNDVEMDDDGNILCPECHEVIA